MFRRYIAVTIIILAIGVISYPEKPRKILSETPDVIFNLPNGNESSLKDFQGKITLVHFWASWCPPCVYEMPQIVKLANDNIDNINIIGFSLDKSAKDMNRFMQNRFGELPSNFLSIWDNGGVIAQNKFYSFSYPETYILNCDGKLVQKISGAATNWEGIIKPHLESCISK